MIDVQGESGWQMKSKKKKKRDEDEYQEKDDR